MIIHLIYIVLYEIKSDSGLLNIKKGVMNRGVFNKFGVIIIFVIGFACNNTTYESTNNSDKAISSKYVLKGEKHFLTDYKAMYDDGDVNVVIEIPAGTREKWEVDKTNGTMKLEFVNNKPRIINYIGYPGNYGMIPQTLLPKELGGDGDPLDVIVLGSPVERGSVLKCKIIGVLNLLDRGECDDKLIGVVEGTPFYATNSIKELNEQFNGVSQIVELWFNNYKGPNKMISKGFSDKKQASEILNTAIQEYHKKHNKNK